MNNEVNELIVDDTVAEVTDVAVAEEGAKKGLTLGQGILIATGVYFGYRLGKKIFCVVRDKIRARKEAKKAATSSDETVVTEE